MRLLGILEGQSNAESLVAYLVTCDISTHVEPIEGRPDAWELWVRDENRMSDAIRELDAFRQSPADSKYSQAVRVAHDIVREKQQKRAAAAKNIRKVRNSGIPGSLGGRMPPLTLMLCITCIALSLATQFGETKKLGPTWRSVFDKMTFVDEQLLNQTNSASASLVKGELWRVVTPIFLHGNPMHLIFNILMLAQLGRLCERLEGTGRFAILVLLIAIASSLLQGLMPFDEQSGIPAMFRGSPRFIGISGVVFGLFGFLWIKTQLRPDLGIRINDVSVAIMLGALVLGFFGAFGVMPIANLCHLGGLLSGMLLGFVSANLNTQVRNKRAD